MDMMRATQTCMKCGSSLSFEGKTQEITANGHHNRVLYCQSCDRKVISG